MTRTIEVETTAYAEVSLSEFDDDDLIAEMKDRAILQSPAGGMNVLQRIVWEHDIMGRPLNEVVDDIMHEYRMVRGSATQALSEAQS